MTVCTAKIANAISSVSSGLTRPIMRNPYARKITEHTSYGIR